MIFENMVAQELVMRGHGLYFCKFYTKGSTNIQEVDFLLMADKKVIPVECESGRISTAHKSLDRFVDKCGKKRIGQQYVIHPRDLVVDGDLTYIPIYMTMFLRPRI